LKDSDELFTIEIHFETNKKPKEENKEQIKFNSDKPEPKKIEVYGPQQIIDERLKALKEKAEKWREAKNRAFLDLRDAIFDQNRGAVKTTRDTFLKQAEKYKNETSEPVSFVPFTCYWPTYDVMSDSQRKWYFFWRDRARHGEYLQTALSYIFLYVYELLGEIGVEDECDGFIKLCNIWGEFRTYFPTIDKYIEQWTADYIAIHFKDGLPEFIFNSINYPETINHLPTNLIIDYIFRTGLLKLGDENAITYIGRFSNYKIEASKFYQKNDKAEINESITLVICHLNNYLKDKTDKGILQTYTPAYIKPQTRLPYQNAIYQGKVKSVEVDAFDYTKNKSLRDFFTAVIKQTENILRKMSNYKGKLTNELPKEYSDVIEKFLLDRRKRKIIEERSKIEMNVDKIRQLIHHSNEIRDKLLEGSEFSTDETMSEEIAAEQPAPPTAAKADSKYGNLSAYLTETQRLLLSFITERGGSILYNELSNSFNGVFVQMEIDNINEAAISCLGDILILSEGEELIIQEI